MRREEIVVVGGGIAGIAAALTARRNGASVTLIDEGPAVGGYLRWTIGEQQGLPDTFAGKRGFQVAEEGWNLLYDADVNVQVRSTAWGFFNGNVLGVVNPESSYKLTAERFILATGSTDRGVPFPGWELAGVMTARAALIAVNIHRVLPGGQVALIGNGSDAAEVRESLELVGVDIVAHLADVTTTRAGGDAVVEWVESGDDRYEVDAVVTVHGVQPDQQLALQSLVQTGFSAHSAMHVPLRSRNLETSLPGVYVVGDAAGTCTAVEAFAEGVVAGEAASGGRRLDDALGVLARARSTERLADLDRLQPEVEVS